MALSAIVTAGLNRDLAEAEFKLRLLESELLAVPAGAKSTMGTLRLTRRVKAARDVYESWAMVVQLVKEAAADL